ncbi:MAG: PTS sugar transporter subunit IIB [Deltaproteobacteria bacterium]|nr:PTS sugar transporter subunit IIB [Deltaproteobacteria bacterium]
MDNFFVRIDDRLVHGQILEAWIPYLRTRAIVVIDDELAFDDFRKMVIAMVIPQGIQISFFSSQQFNSKWQHGAALQGGNILFLFPNTSTLLTVFNAGFMFQRLNIGNLCSPEAVKLCTPSVMLNATDIKNIKTLLMANVAVDLRRTPNDVEEAIDLSDDEK